MCGELAVNPLKILQDLDVDVDTFHRQQQGQMVYTRALQNT